MTAQHQIFHDLASEPAGLRLRSVTAIATDISGRRALRVELTDRVTLEGQPGIDYIDKPTFAIMPIEMTDGIISVDILSRLNGNAPNYARAFAGIAYRIAGEGNHFEAVYLRPLNGLKCCPPVPRDKRAIQYFAYPEWPFDRLRETYADGRYEAGANIGPSEWNTLKLDICGSQLTASVNGQTALVVGKAKIRPQPGAIGLFVDIGTEAYFSNLTVLSRQFLEPPINGS